MLNEYMDVSFYLQGEVVPIQQDNDMDLDGILVPKVRHVARQKGIWVIVLKREKGIPKSKQRRGIISTVRFRTETLLMASHSLESVILTWIVIHARFRMEEAMSRIAATYLNTPLVQLERLDTVKSVFERNTRAQIDNALGFVSPSEDVLRLAEEVKSAAAAVVLAHADESEMDVASRTFVSLVKQLQFALLRCGQRQGASKHREISALGAW